MRLRDWLARVMAGRYGKDQLNHFLTLVSLILFIVCLFIRTRTGRNVLFYLALIALLIVYYRAFSRNHAKRSAENTKYLQIKEGLFGSFSKKKQQMQDKDHAYFKCLRCKKMLRVPKGKGRISIHCPQCGTDFIETT